MKDLKSMTPEELRKLYIESLDSAYGESRIMERSRKRASEYRQLAWEAKQLLEKLDKPS